MTESTRKRPLEKTSAEKTQPHPKEQRLEETTTTYSQVTNKALASNETYFVITKNGPKFHHLTREKYETLYHQLGTAAAKERNPPAFSGFNYIRERAVIKIDDERTRGWIKDTLMKLAPGYLASNSKEGPNLIRYGAFVPDVTDKIDVNLIVGQMVRQLNHYKPGGYHIRLLGKHKTSNLQNTAEKYWVFGVNNTTAKVIEERGKVFQFPLSKITLRRDSHHNLIGGKRGPSPW